MEKHCPGWGRGGGGRTGGVRGHGCGPCVGVVVVVRGGVRERSCRSRRTSGERSTSAWMPPMTARNTGHSQASPAADGGLVAGRTDGLCPLLRGLCKRLLLLLPLLLSLLLLLRYRRHYTDTITVVARSCCRFGACGFPPATSLRGLAPPLGNSANQPGRRCADSRSARFLLPAHAASPAG